MAQALDFVKECGKRWGVHIVWLEYKPARPEIFEIVDHATASRHGEPFERLLGDRGMPPNPETRFCTAMLKTRTKDRIASSLGSEPLRRDLGLRADEPRLLARLHMI